MECRCVRGATTVNENTEEAILASTQEMLMEMIATNKIDHSEISAIFFTATKDLDNAYPARAAREMGFTDIALMCMQEMNVADSLPMCIRVMIMWNTHKELDELIHIYLRGAKILRPDIVKGNK